ncbi:Mu transposase domain-containing protein [Arthrobacter sp. NQ4]|uniref:Mu transposase domain-containing protein n=1 Tax=Arthrobacter sp. NQ4 TaxID=3027930 RepID=UPI0035A91A64
MLALPPVPPGAGFTARVRLPRDHCVRMGSNDYSVHQQAIGRFVDVAANLTTATISLDGRPVGTHFGPGAPAGPSPTPLTPRRQGHCGRPSKPLHLWAKQPGCGTWRTTTAPSAWSSTTGRSPDARSQRNDWPDRVLLPGDEGTPDP